LALATLTLTSFAGASVTERRLYRLGEDDVPAPVPAGAGDNSTVDSVGGVNASKVGLEFYHFNGGGGGPPTSLGIAPGSTQSMEFTNVDSRYTAPAFTGQVADYGLEIYIQPGPGAADSRFFYNGGPGFPQNPPTNGLGLGIALGQYVGIINGQPSIASGIPAVPGQPVAVAIVTDSLSGLTSLYVQGQLRGSSAAPPLPVAAGDVLSLGNFVDNFSPPLFGGVLDEARVFTFLPGAFDPNANLGVPEPATPLIACALGLLAIWRRRPHRPGAPA
jgi:hypothetical protein